MSERKIYIRHVTKREPINRFGKLGYVEHVEAVEADEEELARVNYCKKIRFEEKDLDKEDPAVKTAVLERLASHNKGSSVDCVCYNWRTKQWTKIY